MPRSMRWRLQLWYGLVLLGVVSSFAGILYYRMRAVRLQEIDTSLLAAARYLDVHLRQFPLHDLDVPHPDRPPPPEHPDWPPPDEMEKGPHGRPRPFPPARPSRERLLGDLTAPKPAYFAVWRADGSVVKSSDLPEGITAAGVSCPPEPMLSQRGDDREASMLGPMATRILVGRSIRKELAELRTFAWQLGGAGLVVLVLGLTGGWLISARILRPVAVIVATASSISATNLAERIDPEQVDRELADLARVLNAMFERLEGEFERQARFTADASHELRTPLSILRSHIELALSRPRSSEEYQETLQTCLRAAGRMTALVDGLLTLARADAGKLDLHREPVALGEVVEESIALVRPLAQSKGIQLTATLAPAEVHGDAGRLGQVVTNLLTNAIQYNRPGGRVAVQLQRTAEGVVLSVTDTGYGIPEEDQAHICERFYRVDKARARASGGYGLGLAICKSIVEAHGGCMRFRSVANEGTTFDVQLPLPR